MIRLLWAVWVPAASIALWQIAAQLGVASPLLLPAPTVLFGTAWRMIGSGELPANAGATLARASSGFALGSILGLAVGTPMGSLRRVSQSLDSIISALNATPKLVLLPLFFLVLGIGEQARIALIAVASLVIVAIHTADAIRHIRPAWIEMAVNYGATRATLIRDVYLPGCLPQVFTGLRLALGNALVIAISCELVSPSSGIGSVIWLAWQTFAIDRLYVAILATGLLGALLHAALRMAERWLVPWIPHERA